MRFLVTNDDGIYAPGIRTLVETLTSFGEVVVVAPHQERSGVGHGITVNHPLRVHQIELFQDVPECYMVDGTPADCVKLAIQGLDRKPDLVVSGINIGANLGTDVLYSGTVSAAMEGTLLGIPSMAISLCKTEEFLATAAHYVAYLLFDRKIPFPSDGLLNVNVPSLPTKQVKGIRTTKLSIRLYNNEFDKRQDPQGKSYYWMKGIPYAPESGQDHDHVAIDQGFVSVTPIHFDLTHHAFLSTLNTALD